MFSLETANIEKAINNAKALHPKVKMIEFGTYEVAGCKGNTYTMRCYRKGCEKMWNAIARHARASHVNTDPRPARFTSRWRHSAAIK